MKKFNSFVIVDDLLATGGTVNCVSKLLQDQRKEVQGLITVIELNKLKGRALFDFPVQSIISIWIIEYLNFKNKRNFSIFINISLDALFT